jgi:hypothetical protein
MLRGISLLGTTAIELRFDKSPERHSSKVVKVIDNSSLLPDKQSHCSTRHRQWQSRPVRITQIVVRNVTQPVVVLFQYPVNVDLFQTEQAIDKATDRPILLICWNRKLAQ